MACRHSTSASSVSRDGACDANNNSLLSGDNLLRLALKKPDSWKWELTTSSSSPNISFPKIQLFDGASGELMVEVDQPDCVIRSADRSSASSPAGSESGPRMVRYGRSRTALVKEKRPTTSEALADIFSQLSSKGLGDKLSTSGSQYRLANGEPDASRRVLHKSKSASAIAAQEAMPVVRRKSRRSVASRSSSILERISEFYGRSSTDDDDENSGERRLAALGPGSGASEQEQEQEQKADPGVVTIEEMSADAPPVKARPKIYKLVRSNAGTLMVREESFHTQRSLRRRQREALDGDFSEQQRQSCERYVEIDERLDRPLPEASRYEQEINRIDHLLSRVMLSHDLHTEPDAQGQQGRTPNIHISSPAPAPAPAPAHQLQNRRVRHTRRGRRSVSVGSRVTSARHHSISSGRSSSPADRRIGRRRRSSSSSSDETCGSRLLHNPPTGSSSRSNSLKRRGRTRRRGDPRDSSTAKSNASTYPLRLPPWPAHDTNPVNWADPQRSRRCRSADGGGGGGGGGDGDDVYSALALASLRPPAAAPGESSSRETDSLIDIDVRTIGAIRTVTSQYTAATAASEFPPRPRAESSAAISGISAVASQQQQQQQQQQLCSSTSSSVTLSSLSPLSTASAENQEPSRELARSGSDRSLACARAPVYRAFRNSVSFPLSGDFLRSAYMMQQPVDNQPPSAKKQLLAPPEQPQPLRELPPKQPAAEPPKTYAEVLRAIDGPSTNVQAKPPAGQVRPQIRVTSEEDGEFVVDTGLANTVEPPMRARRTLKHYSRRHRTSFQKE